MSVANPPPPPTNIFITFFFFFFDKSFLAALGRHKLHTVRPVCPLLLHRPDRIHRYANIDFLSFFFSGVWSKSNGFRRVAELRLSSLSLARAYTRQLRINFRDFNKVQSWVISYLTLPAPLFSPPNLLYTEKRGRKRERLRGRESKGKREIG